MTLANRGKASEKIVEAIFKKWNNQMDFSWHRFPDSRSARGALAAQPGDFLYFCKSRAGVVEVKHTEHAYRVAKDKISQLMVLKKFAQAGASSLILIHHGLKNVWRVLDPLSLASDVPSWDLREFPCYPDAETALLSSNYFN